MTDNDFDDVGLFHAKFGLPFVSADEGDAGPREWDAELIEFRRKFLHEELKEFEDGILAGDDAMMADALVDLVYVALGTAHLLGYPWHTIWSRVQQANMAKVRAAKDGSDSVRGSAWDVVKPPGWTAPDVVGVLRAFGFELPETADA
jgi:predicted HAD superfamily Cof-like phosphohydrolase